MLLEAADFTGMNDEWLRWFPVGPPARQAAELAVPILAMPLSITAIAEA